MVRKGLKNDITEGSLIINKNKQNQVDSGGQIPSGHGGPHPSGDSVALPPISAGYSDCKHRPDTAVTINCSEVSNGSSKVSHPTWHQLHCNIPWLQYLQTARHQ